LYDAALAELAAVGYAGPAVPEPRTDRSARQNLLAVFTAHCDVLPAKPRSRVWPSWPGSSTNPNRVPSSPTLWWHRVFGSSNRSCAP
jgi:hypothetical protein